ncbi:MAG: AAA family ATPase, partial [Thiotrichales bacterium SG8_50]
SGKTTLVKTLFQNLPYVLLEDPDIRRYATEDPRGFLAKYQDGAVFDEAQRAPELFSYLQGIVDQDPKPGRFILTGSQQFGLLSGITQSLAGRVAMMILLPFSLDELTSAGVKTNRLEDVLCNGGYPPIHDRGLDARTWAANYVATYVERDVRQLISVRDLSTFETFLRMCAARCGQLVNLSGLANDCGISHNTARSWLSVLEASYVVHTLAPHHRNFSKRLIKSPKLYFLDPGLAAWLLNIRSPDQITTHSMRGPLFETWVLSEILKSVFNSGNRPNLYFWRDRAGLEVDFIADFGDRLIPIEVKSGATFVSEWLSPLKRWSELAGKDGGPGWIVYGGDTGGKRKAIETVPWRQIGRLTKALSK